MKVNFRNEQTARAIIKLRLHSNSTPQIHIVDSPFAAYVEMMKSNWNDHRMCRFRRREAGEELPDRPEVFFQLDGVRTFFVPDHSFFGAEVTEVRVGSHRLVRLLREELFG